MKKHLLTVMLTTIFLLAFTVSAMAVEGDVTTFGFNDNRNREGYSTAPILWAAWGDNCGTSYSQPLILKGWSNHENQVLAVVAAGKELRGYVMKEPDYSGRFQHNEPIWKLPLHGAANTKSHPTLVEKDGKKYIYIGTEKEGSKSYIDIFDLTDFDKAYRYYFFRDLWASDIVSAPLVLNWKGHEVVVYTAGNSAEIHLATDILQNGGNLRINLGSGRTSSSPAPILNRQGFAVGLDQGTNSGQLQLFKLDDILAEQNGKVVKKSDNSYDTLNLNAGLVASFAVDGDWLCFGDCQSRIYGYNAVTGAGWRNVDNIGIFSNRSPAITQATVYFPAVNTPGKKGKLIAVDRATHQTKWAVGFGDRAQTAPVIWRIQGTNSAVAFEGIGNGWMAGIDTYTGAKYQTMQIANVDNNTSYGTGVSGEISFGHDWMVATTEDGVKAWKAVPFNLKAVKLNSGVANGGAIQKGAVYNGTFTVKNEHSLLNISTIPVGVYKNGTLLILKDTNGNELPKGNYLGKECYFVDLNTQEEKVLSFSWTASDNKVELIGAINESPTAQKYPETTYQDNVLKEQLTAPTHDIAVKIMPLKTNWVIGGSTETIKTTVGILRKDTIPGAIPIKLTVTGAGGTKVQTFNLEPGKNTQFPYNFNAGPGTYKISAEAWPTNNSWEDSYPKDNKDTITITVKKKNLPSPGSGIRVGL